MLPQSVLPTFKSWSFAAHSTRTHTIRHSKQKPQARIVFGSFVLCLFRPLEAEVIAKKESELPWYWRSVFHSCHTSVPKKRFCDFFVIYPCFIKEFHAAWETVLSSSVTKQCNSRTRVHSIFNMTHLTLPARSCPFTLQKANGIRYWQTLATCWLCKTLQHLDHAMINHYSAQESSHKIAPQGLIFPHSSFSS